MFHRWNEACEDMGLENLTSFFNKKYSRSDSLDGRVSTMKSNSEKHMFPPSKA
jgi:hypothetical protein